MEGGWGTRGARFIFDMSKTSIDVHVLGWLFCNFQVSVLPLRTWRHQPVCLIMPLQRCLALLQMLMSLWKMNVVDIENTLKSVCSQVPPPYLKIARLHPSIQAACNKGISSARHEQSALILYSSRAGYYSSM